MLTIHILNVGQGDSAVLQYDSPQGKTFAVIDSNHIGDGNPPALSKLEELGAKEISFVALTHPHKDHYSGLSEILKKYKNKIDKIYIFPLGSYTAGRFRQLAEIYHKIYKNSDNEKLKIQLKEFVEILSLIKPYVGKKKLEELSGPHNIIGPKGFAGVEIAAILPLRKVKGTYFQMIEQGSEEIVETHEKNELSLAFSITYKGLQIVLGGDGPYHSWMDHKKDSENRNFSFNGFIVKLPHHGAKKDCDPKVIDYLFSDENCKKTAFISADGFAHPHIDTYKTLQKRKIIPYCTNLSVHCGANLRKLYNDSDFSQTLLRFINMTATQNIKKNVQPCQGNISIKINEQGKLESIEPEYKNPCVYRGDFDFIQT